MRSEQVGRAELTALVAAALETAQAHAEPWNDNPQVIEMATRASGRAEAFDAVLRALTHRERYGLRVFAAGHIAVRGD